MAALGCATIAGMVESGFFARALGDARVDRRLEILRLVDVEGSISQAARTAGVSYKAAWDALQRLADAAGEPLVQASTGGAGGGGARLLPAGRRLLQAARNLQRVRTEVLEGPVGVPAPDLAQTSMRNRLRCRVVRLESALSDDPAVQVLLETGGGTLQARITRDSSERLGIRPGGIVLALAKATAVMVQAADGPGAGQPGVLCGEVARMKAGAERDEVELSLPDGQCVVGFSSAARRLRPGAAASASIDACAVVLARVP